MSSESSLRNENNPVMTCIKASAGSGKTYRLTRQFLSLLACSDLYHSRQESCSVGTNASLDWRSILAITFTNAAATEMQERVLRCLKEEALGISKEPVMHPRFAAAWLDIILHDRGSLNISTIDSLLNLILRMSALSQNLPPDFTPVFTTDEILKPCMEEMMNEAWECDTKLCELVHRACTAIVENSEWSGFLALDGITRRLRQLLPLIFQGKLQGLTPIAKFQQPDGTGILPRMRRDIVQAIQKILSEDGKFESKDAKVLELNKTFTNSMQKIIEKVKRNFKILNTTPEKASLGDYVFLDLKPDDLGSTFFIKQVLPVKKSGATAPDMLSALFSSLCEHVADYTRVEFMYRQALLYAPLLDLANIVCNRLERKRLQNGTIPNDSIPLMVKNILSESMGVSEALCRLGTRLTHFLVDEFQDTSRVHWKAIRPLIIEALSRGGSFTWVGDVKQAIYGFRGGDSQLFDDIAHDKGLATILGHSANIETLDINWRSCRSIVAFNNALFDQLHNTNITRNVLLASQKNFDASITCRQVRDLLPGLDDSQLDMTILEYVTQQTVSAYSRGTQKCPSCQQDVGAVHLILFDKDTDDKVTESFNDGERESNTEGILLDEKDPQYQGVLHAAELEHVKHDRPWSDVLILVRTNFQARALARYLSQKRVPVITENSLLLSEHPLIVQTLALLRFLRTPADDISFWILITGNIFTHEDDTKIRFFMDDYLLELKKKTKKKDSALWQAWADMYPEAFDTHLQTLMKSASPLTPYDIVCEWYDHEQVFERFPESAPFFLRFQEILSACQAQNIRSLSGFLDYWDAHGSEEKVPMPEGMDAVRIMTVHKAKGLQAQVVIVPWTSTTDLKSPPLDIVEYVLQKGHGEVLTSLCNRKKFFPEAALVALRESLESINRFYVAFTRPEHTLYIFLSKKSEGDGRILDCLLQNVSRDIPEPVSGAQWIQAPLLMKSFKTDVAEMQSLSGVWSCPGRTVWSSVRTDSAQGCFWEPMGWVPKMRVHLGYLDESYPRDPAKEQGIFVHKCLETICRLPKNARGGYKNIVNKAFLAHPWLKSIPGFFEQVTEEIGWFLSLPHVHDWLDHGMAEQSLVYSSGDGDAQTLRVDLLIPETKRTIVIDYKRGWIRAKEKNAYCTQMQRYLDCLKQAGSPDPIGLLLLLTERRCLLVTCGMGNTNTTCSFLTTTQV